MNLLPSGWAVHPMCACEDKIACLAAPNTEGVIAQRLFFPGAVYPRVWALVATRGRSDPRLLGILGPDTGVVVKSRAVGPSA